MVGYPVHGELLNWAAKDGPLGGYVVTLDGKVTPVTPEGVSWIRLSPSGHSVAVSVGSDQIVIYPIDGGKPYPVPGVLSGDYIAGWSLDEQSLYVYHATDVPARVFRLNLKTGKREFWKTLAPSDRAGVSAIEPVIIAPDGKSYAYGLNRRLSDLLVVEGLK